LRDQALAWGAEQLSIDRGFFSIADLGGLLAITVASLLVLFPNAAVGVARTAVKIQRQRCVPGWACTHDVAALVNESTEYSRHPFHHAVDAGHSAQYRREPGSINFAASMYSLGALMIRAVLSFPGSFRSFKHRSRFCSSR
jgi:hypothetical protein